MRTTEFGIRSAPGEPRRTLCGRVLREALATALAGTAPGVCGAVLLSGLVRSLVFGVSALDPLSLGAACVLLASIAIAAASLPAMRASRVDPASALRQE